MIISQDVRCIQTQPWKWNESHTASTYWWNEVLCGYQHIRMQTTSKFMYPLFTLCCFTVRWLSGLCLVAYLWKISTHHPAPLPPCSIYSAQVPEVWTTLCPDSARCPSPVLLRLCDMEWDPICARTIFWAQAGVNIWEVLRQCGRNG